MINGILKMFFVSLKIAVVSPLSLPVPPFPWFLQQCTPSLTYKNKEMFQHTLRNHLITAEFRFYQKKGRSLFHLLGIVFDLIGNLDHFVWSAVQLMRDDFLKVLQDNRSVQSLALNIYIYIFDFPNISIWNYYFKGDNISSFPTDK